MQFDRVFHISVMAGLICRIAFHAVITLCNELKVSECKAYWLTDFPLVISWACAKKQLLDTSTIIFEFTEKISSILVEN